MRVNCNAPLESEEESGFLALKFSSLVTQMVKNLLARVSRPRFNPWVGKIPWRRKFQPTPVVLPRNSHGQETLTGFSPGVAESDMAE